eukprot:Selendium_serpulae@DN3976_c1_g1_i1.p2
MGFCSLICWSLCCFLMSITACVVLGLFAIHAKGQSHLLHIPSDHYDAAYASSMIVLIVYLVVAICSAIYIAVFAVLRKRKGSSGRYDPVTSGSSGGHTQLHDESLTLEVGGTLSGSTLEAKGGRDPLDSHRHSD